MTVQWSAAVRNAIMAGWEAGVGASAKVELRTGAQPANTAAAATGTLLATFSLAADWASAPDNGTVTLTGLPVVVEALEAGTVGHYRITDTAGTTCHEQGSVTATAGGGDMTMDNPVLAQGQSAQLTSWSKTAPGA